MQTLIIQIELKQIFKVISEVSNSSVVTKTKVTVVIVNKRISQRFFGLSRHNVAENP
jgi:hypothetical protein